MLEGIAAVLLTSIIWGYVVTYYKILMKKDDFLKLNMQRLFSALAIGLPVLIVYWDTRGYLYSLLSGIVGLGIGDTLYFFAIKNVGATIAAPIAYTYIIIAQLIASSLYEEVNFYTYLASVVTFSGIAVISLGEERKDRNLIGMLAAFIAGLSWALSAFLIKKAVLIGSPIYAISYFRLIGASLFLFSLLSIKDKKLNVPMFKNRRLIVISFIDLFLGAALYSFSVKILGLSLTVILVSTSPMFTQFFSRLMGTEILNKWKLVGTLLILAGVILSQLRTL